MRFFYLKLRDGFGAVFQQILAAIGLAKQYNLIYLYDKKFMCIEHHIKTLDSFIDTDSFFKKIPENIIFSDTPQNFNLDNFKENEVALFNKLHAHVERYFGAELYEQAADKILPYLKKPKSHYSSEYINVAIHLRRGDIAKVNSRYLSDRYIPIDYYLKCIKYIESLPSEKPYQFHVYTQPDQTDPAGLNKLIKENIKIYKDEKDDVEQAFLDWWHLSYADILIQSKSSYSYTAGFFNKNLVYHIPFWHKPLKRWKNLNDHIT